MIISEVLFNHLPEGTARKNRNAQVGSGKAKKYNNDDEKREVKFLIMELPRSNGLNVHFLYPCVFLYLFFLLLSFRFSNCYYLAIIKFIVNE